MRSRGGKKQSQVPQTYNRLRDVCGSRSPDRTCRQKRHRTTSRCTGKKQNRIQESYKTGIQSLDKRLLLTPPNRQT